MKLLLRRAIMLLGCVLLLSGSVFADWQDAYSQYGGDSLVDALPKEALERMGDYQIGDTDGFSAQVRGILDGALEDSGSVIRSAISVGIQIMMIVLFAAAMHAIGRGRTAEVTTLAAVLAISLLGMNRISGVYTRTQETVDSMTAFSAFLFSSLAATTAATGAVGTSSSMYVVTAGICGMLSGILQRLIFPAISCYLALSVTGYALEEDGLRQFGDGIKQLISMLLKFVVILFTAYLSITGVIRGTADSAAIRAAKLTISTAVPVVGSMIADASETILVSAGLLRSGIGVFGLLGVLAMSVAPFLEVGIGYLTMKLTAAAAGVISEKQLSGVISALAGALGLVTAVAGVCTLLIVIGCVCFMQVVIR